MGDYEAFTASAWGCDGAESGGDSLYVAIIQSNLGATGLAPFIFVPYIFVSSPPSCIVRPGTTQEVI